MHAIIMLLTSWRRASRVYQLKGPLPPTPNKVSVSREGQALSINADVISVGDSRANSSRRSRANSNSNSNSNSNPLFPAQGDIPGNYYAEPSVRASSPRRSLSPSRSISTSSVVSYKSMNTVSTMLTQSSLHTAVLASNNLQLSQKAYKELRKKHIRAGIQEFLAEAQSHSSLPDGPAWSPSLSPGRPDGKKNRLNKLIANLRVALKDELSTHPHTLEEVFFPAQHLYAENVVNLRAELLDIIQVFHRKLSKQILPTLDKYFQKHAAVQEEQARLSAESAAALAHRSMLWDKRQALKAQITSLQESARSKGVNLTDLLNKFPADWLQEEYSDSENEDDWEEMMDRSVFLSPEKHVRPAQPPQPQSVQQHAIVTTNPVPMPLAAASVGQQQQSIAAAVPLAVGPVKADRFAVNIHALKLLSDEPAASASIVTTSMGIRPSSAGTVSPQASSSNIVYYNLSPDDELLLPERTRQPAHAKLPEPKPDTRARPRSSSPNSLAAAHKIDLHYLAYAGNDKPRAVSPKYALYVSSDRSVSSLGTGTATGTGVGTSTVPSRKVITPKKRTMHTLSDFS